MRLNCIDVPTSYLVQWAGKWMRTKESALHSLVAQRNSVRKLPEKVARAEIKRELTGLRPRLIALSKGKDAHA